MTNAVNLVTSLAALARAGVPTDIQELLINGDPMRGIAPGALDKAISAHQSSSLESAVEFVAKMCWRSDPPNANASITIEERFSAIKYHPTIKKYGEDHP